MEKTAIRQQYIKLRQMVPADVVSEAAEKIIPTIEKLIPKNAKIIAGYMPMQGELNATPVMKVLSDAGKQLALPVVQSKILPLLFAPYKMGEKLQPGVFHVPVPKSTAWVVPDVLLVPLVAFNEKCFRIGYGAGFYDRTIAQLRKENPKLLTIGLAYQNQLCDNLPLEEHDQRLDVIVTEKSTLYSERT